MEDGRSMIEKLLSMGSKTGRLAREQPAGRDHNKSQGNTPGHLLSANILIGRVG